MQQPQPYLNPHQARDREPTFYENLLADAIERAYAAGVHDIEGLVQQMNELCVPSPGGQTWSVELLTEELRRLGA